MVVSGAVVAGRFLLELQVPWAEVPTATADTTQEDKKKKERQEEKGTPYD